MPHRANTTLALVLAVVLLAALVPVTAVMLAPSDRDAVVAALTTEGEAILAAAMQYPSAFAVDRSGEAEGGQGPFHGLRFDRIGYYDNLTPDARGWITEVGTFRLIVEDGGRAFTLTASGADGIGVRWEGVRDDPVPEPVEL